MMTGEADGREGAKKQTRRHTTRRLVLVDSRMSPYGAVDVAGTAQNSLNTSIRCCEIQEASRLSI